MAFKIAFFDTKPYDRASFDEVNEKYGFEILYHKGQLNRNNVVLTQGMDAICIFVHDTADTAIIEQMAGYGVKLIALRAAGYNNVDLAAAKDKLKVVRVPAYWRTRDGNFALHGLMGFDMNGKTAGIIGTGKIARILIRILQGFGMKVVAYDLYPDEKYAREVGISYVSLDSLYAQADMISLHVPLTDQTKNMIDAQSIAKMKEGTIIINTSRGQLIHTNALIEGLKSKKIAAAGLDVYEEEEGYFYEDQSDKIIDDDVLARLLSFNNVIVTSHQGFFTREAMHNIAETTLQNIQDFIDGKTLVNEVS